MPATTLLPANRFYSVEPVTDDTTIHIDVERDPSADVGEAVTTILFQHGGNASFQLSLPLDQWEEIVEHIADQLFAARTTMERN